MVPEFPKHSLESEHKFTLADIFCKTTQGTSLYVTFELYYWNDLLCIVHVFGNLYAGTFTFRKQLAFWK